MKDIFVFLVLLNSESRNQVPYSKETINEKHGYLVHISSDKGLSDMEDRLKRFIFFVVSERRSAQVTLVKKLPKIHDIST